jgi:hypothetical protein
MDDTLDRCLGLLDEVLASQEKENLDQTVPKLQKLVWDTSDGDNTAWEILRDLAYDLDYYVSDSKSRAEDPSYYGEDRAMEEIRTARNRLKEMLKR